MGSIEASSPLLSMVGIHKWFGGVHALSDARLVVERPGVVHALMGQNGSGKSTMLNILSGQVRPDQGEIFLQGRRVKFGSPPDALAEGISMVSQETALAEDLSVAENVLLGRRLVRGRFGIDWKSTRSRARAVLERLGVDYDPRWLVRNLRPDQKQVVEIARALSSDVSILILDEPTSSLTEDETQGLYAAIRRLRAEGVCILYVSHRLPDVFEIADEITVFRDGVTVAERPKEDFTPRSLITAMVGAEQKVTERKTSVIDRRTPAVEIRGLSVEGVATNVSLDVYPGEIVGLAGLVGSGRSEILQAVFGLRKRSSGTVSVDGRPLEHSSPRGGIESGMGFVPPDRKTQGLILNMSVWENLCIPATYDRWRLGSPSGGGMKQKCSAVSSRLQIKGDLEADARTLSGGNQQKVALGKWLLRVPKVLLLDEPTRGVDVSAKGEIHRQLRDAAAEGIAMLVSSSEYDELYELCDRIAVLFRGRIVATLPREEVSEAKIAHLAGGAGQTADEEHVIALGTP